MSVAPCNNRAVVPHRQRGDMLIEALVGMLLMAVLGLGLTYAASRTMTSQRYMNTQNLAVEQLREKLQTTGLSGLCAAGTTGASIQIGGQSSTLQATNCTRAAVTISGTGVPSGAISSSNAPYINATVGTAATDSNAALFGGNGQVSVAQ